ncbi:MAG: heavy-metal-associated domain-containing protein [Oscillospiraceae bacterium]|nr:heavy-metal-associated domain-containing protein [Oscillospiraceae bacterium]
MNTATYIIIAIVAVIVFFAIRSSAKHMKGEGGCCGGGDTVIREEAKVLDNPVIGKKIVHIEGMHCENCKNSVERHVNKIEGAACEVDLKKNQAVVSYDREIDENRLRRVIELLDFTVTGIEEA